MAVVRRPGEGSTLLKVWSTDQQHHLVAGLKCKPWGPTSSDLQNQKLLGWGTGVLQQVLQGIPLPAEV